MEPGDDRSSRLRAFFETVGPDDEGQGDDERQERAEAEDRLTSLLESFAQPPSTDLLNAFTEPRSPTLRWTLTQSWRLTQSR